MNARKGWIVAMSLATAIAGSCGPRSVGQPAAAPRIVEGLSATRWVPSEPTYVVAAPTVRHAQQILRDAADSLGMLVGGSADKLASELASLLSVDITSAESLAGIGVDLEASMVVFSDAIMPTFVVKLADPVQTQAFFDRLRGRGLVTQSVLVDGVEVFSAQLIHKAVRVSWAVADEFLWVHFASESHRDDEGAWFQASRAGRGTGWHPSWKWARSTTGAGDAPLRGLAGFADAAELLQAAGIKARDAAACARLAGHVQRVALTVETDGRTARGNVAFDLGGAASKLAAAHLAAPEGLERLAEGAALAVQWNLDLPAVRDALRPCLAVLEEDVSELDRYGVRAGRAVLRRFEPDDKRADGAVSLELVHSRYLRSQLDQIPLRSSLERSRTFGPHKGFVLSIPFVTSFEYVLTDTLALAGMGDGMLATLVGRGETRKGPLFELAISPHVMSAESWEALLGLVADRDAGKLVERLLRWREGRVRASLSGSSLVLSVSGTRR